MIPKRFFAILFIFAFSTEESNAGFNWFTRVQSPISDLQEEVQPYLLQENGSSSTDSTQLEFLRRMRQPPITVFGWIFSQMHLSSAEEPEYYKNTFSVPRAHLGARGTFASGLSYKVQMNLANEPNLVDAMIAFKPTAQTNIRMGVFKPFLNPDFFPNPARADLIDRAYTSRFFFASREVGVDLEWSNGPLTAWLGLYNGDRISENKDDAFMGTGRVQWLGEMDSGSLRLGVFGLRGIHSSTPLGIDRLLTARGPRNSFGADLEIRRGTISLKSEGVATEVVESLKASPNLYGAFMTTVTWSASKERQFLVRVEHFARLEEGLEQEGAPDDGGRSMERSQLTLGWTARFSPLLVLKVNALSTFDDDFKSAESGLIGSLQFEF